MQCSMYKYFHARVAIPLTVYTRSRLRTYLRGSGARYAHALACKRNKFIVNNCYTLILLYVREGLAGAKPS